ncbi:MAG: hypothetical protein AAGA03_06220, partial [Planctomycetota bacterium]
LQIPGADAAADDPSFRLDPETMFDVDPFADDPQTLPPPKTNQLPPPRTTDPIADPTLPSEQRPMNQLRDPFGPEPGVEPPTAPASDDSIGEMLRRETPDEMAEPLPPADPTESPSDLDRTDPEPDLFENTFGPDPNRAQDDPSSDPQFDRPTDARAAAGDRGGISCDTFRERIASQTIRSLTLDISPPLRPDIIDQATFDREREKFESRQVDRQWRSIDGRPLARGRLIDLAYEQVIIETDFGTRETLPQNRLSEADLAYISDNWGLPKECHLEQVAHQSREWQPTTMTYLASNLCHKPLYFEEVNLERYGHTAGPFLQPVVSSAHFFANIAVLPYKMGVHAPNECQYVLGYYRPGNCAPWIVPPVPISARGALTQTAAMTGLFWLVP